MSVVETYRLNYPGFEPTPMGSQRGESGPAPTQRPAVIEWETAAPMPTSWCQAVRQSIVAAAFAEERFWTGGPNDKYSENDPARRPDLARYWSAVPGFSNTAAALAAPRRSAADDPHWAWSAAFICFVMRSAGVQPSHGFEFGGRHMTYVVGALRNRELRDRTRPFWLVDALELQQEVLPQPGDLSCSNRPVCRGTPQVCIWTTHTVASLRRQYWGKAGENRNVRPIGNSHCSMVVGTHQDPGGNRFLLTMGGNKRNSVRLKRRIRLDKNGRIANPGAHHIFAMIKLIEC